MIQYIYLIILSMLILSGCYNNSRKSDSQSEQQNTKQVVYINELEPNIVSIYNQDKGTVEHEEHDAIRLNEKLSGLLTKFTKEMDEFDKKTIFRHNNYMPEYYTNGITIVAELIDNHIYCYSVFVGSEWLFHEEIFVKAGDVVSKYTGDTRREFFKSVAEAVYVNEFDSVSLAKQIAESNPDKPIKVRLRGKYDYDFKLSPKHRQAIKDTFRLYMLKK